MFCEAWIPQKDHLASSRLFRLKRRNYNNFRTNTLIQLPIYGETTTFA
jgi:hypothetical protein